MGLGPAIANRRGIRIAQKKQQSVGSLCTSRFRHAAMGPGKAKTVIKRYAAAQLQGGMLKVWPMYRIREVDGHDEEIADTLADLHRLTFFNGASIPGIRQGHWWLAFHATMPVGFAGIVASSRAYNAGYFCRVGVLKKHCGNALQLR